MKMDDHATHPTGDPLAALERDLIRAYVAGAGHTLEDLLARHDAESQRLLTDASRYATSKLAEVEARSHYLHRLRGRDA